MSMLKRSVERCRRYCSPNCDSTASARALNDVDSIILMLGISLSSPPEQHLDLAGTQSVRSINRTINTATKQCAFPRTGSHPQARCRFITPPRRDECQVQFDHPFMLHPTNRMGNLVSKRKSHPSDGSARDRTKLKPFENSFKLNKDIFTFAQALRNSCQIWLLSAFCGGFIE